MIGSVATLLSVLNSLEIALLAIFGALLVFSAFAIPYAISVLSSMKKNDKKEADEDKKDEVAGDVISNDCDNNVVDDASNQNETVENQEEPENSEDVSEMTENDETSDELENKETTEENLIEEVEPESNSDDTSEPESETVENQEPENSEDVSETNENDETSDELENKETTEEDLSEEVEPELNSDETSEPESETVENQEPENSEDVSETTENDSAEPQINENDAASVDISKFEPQLVDGFVFFNALKRSFLSKIIQANETTQNYYSEIKNKLLSYRKIHNRMSWGAESFRLGRALKAKMTVRGKTLCLFVALNPDDFNKNIYHQRNFGNRKKYAEVPMMLRVRSPLGLKRALTLIDIMLKDVPLNKKFEYIAYSYAYESDEELIAKDLIRRIRAKRFLDVHEDETVEDAVVRIVSETENVQAEIDDEENEETQFVDDDDDSDIPENLEERKETEAPEFSVEDERSVGAPVIDNGETAPVFVDEENEIIPENLEERKEIEVPEFAEADNENETENLVPESLAEENKVESETVGEAPEFVNPDEVSEVPENLPSAQGRERSKREKDEKVREEVRPEFAESEESDIPPETFENIRKDQTELKKDSDVPAKDNSTPTYEERPSTLPQGLYDDVPDDRKPLKKEEKQEQKRIIPEGLTKDEQKLIDENQALLDELMEGDEDIPENAEVVEIEGVCTDTSEFNNFEMKLYNASNNVKYYYSEIKNTILSYKGIKCKQSNAGDSFRQGNNLISRITLNGNKLRLHLALNPKEYSQNVYNHYSLGHLNAYKDVPFTLEVTKRSDLNTCVKLIQDAMAAKFVIYLAKNREWIDYAAKYTKKED